MKIEIWSDYVCPFCYIGKRRLEEALEVTGLTDIVEVVFKAYQLDPNSPRSTEMTMHEALSKKYNMSLEEAVNMTDNISEQAKTVGLDYDFENMKPGNTFDAHRLVKLAETENLGGAVVESLLHANFIGAKEVGKIDVLLQIAAEAGISQERAKEMFESDEFADDVKADITEARQVGVQGVPFFVINRKYAISGAQPAETFADALRKVTEEEGIRSV
ncbi:DsbA family oxidoreductase [Sporosarcina sp. FA9]|uniref:DsbA family oxidoreductase n=1 Tax=Sporosarcina sp. FA9 TaxID=3413030 RepID=UPI003F6557C6